MRVLYAVLPTWALKEWCGLETFEGHRGETLMRWFFKRLPDGRRQEVMVRFY
jgi:hypothetical protein